MRKKSHRFIVANSHEVVLGDEVMCHLQALFAGVKRAVIRRIVALMQFALAADVPDEFFVGTEVDTTDTNAFASDFLSVAFEVLHLAIVHHTDRKTEGAEFVDGYGMTFGKPTLHLIDHAAHDLSHIALIQSRTRVTDLLDKIVGAEIAVCSHLIVAFLFSCAVHVRHFAF